MPDINLSPYTSQLEAIQQRKKMAELLSQQAMQPLDMPQVAGSRISPYAGLAKLLQAYSGRKNLDQAQAEQKALANQYQTDTSADFSGLLAALTPKAGVPEGPSTFTPNVSEMDMAQNPRMVMRPETDYEGGIIEAGQPGAGYFGVTPGTPAIPASGGRLSAVNFGGMKTDPGRQMFMAQLLAQIKPKEPIKLGKDEVLLDPVTMKPLFQPEAKANFGSINPSQYTPASIKLFMAGGGKDFSVLQAQPNLSFQKTGTAIQAFNPLTGAAVGAGTPISVSPDTAAKLKQDREISDRAFNGLSANQKAQLDNEAKRLNISAQQLYFDTGMQAGGGGGVPNAPVPSAVPLGAAPPFSAQPANMPATVANAPNAPSVVTPKTQQALLLKEAPVKFNDTDLQLSGLVGSLKDFKEEVSKNKFTGAKFLFTGEDTARMKGKYTALLMGLKDLYTLGALTGPDMSIIESQLTNPASWSGKFTNKAGFDAQIKVVEDMVNRSSINLENTYGRVPKATKQALERLSSNDSGEWKVVK